MRLGESAKFALMSNMALVLVCKRRGYRLISTLLALIARGVIFFLAGGLLLLGKLSSRRTRELDFRYAGVLVRLLLLAFLTLGFISGELTRFEAEKSRTSVSSSLFFPVAVSEFRSPVLLPLGLLSSNWVFVGFCESSREFCGSSSGYTSSSVSICTLPLSFSGIDSS